MKKALITGIGGQDGIYLAQFLAKKNYQVFGILNPNSLKKFDPKKYNLSCTLIHDCDIANFKSIEKVLCDIQPDEIYHLASSAEPKVVNNEELSIFEVNFIPGINILNVVKVYLPKSKIYLAGSSLMFGSTLDSTQSETTPMMPNTPYGIAKVALYNFMKMYRDVYGVNTCMGILYNHESPIRSERFLPRKITKAAAHISAGKQLDLKLGDLTITRDWSYAGDIVKSMWLMLQSNILEDYVVGSGVLHTPEDILNIAFSEVGLDWSKYVKTDKSLYRLVECTKLCANPKKINKELNWKPVTSFREMIISMVREDMKLEKHLD
jgi:GDPmannose 4,6-dehydratase